MTLRNYNNASGSRPQQYRRVFLWATGQDDNIGDSMLRRPYEHALRAAGPVIVWVRQASDGFLTGLDAQRQPVRRWGRWYLAILGSAMRGRTLVAINAGEMRVSGRGAVKLALLALAITAARLRGGKGVWVGAGVPVSTKRVLSAIYRAAARSCATVSWRDAESRDFLGIGEVAPDWGFVEGTPVHSWPAVSTRFRLTIVLRGDREYPSAAWWEWVSSVARERALRPTMVVQVARDNTYAERAGREHGFDVVRWETGISHAEQERIVRAVYRESEIAIGDRLHGLIIAATEGAVPLGWVESSTGKIGRHFEAARLKYPGSGEGVDCYVTRSLRDDLWREELRASVEMSRMSLRRLSEEIVR